MSIIEHFDPRPESERLQELCREYGRRLLEWEGVGGHHLAYMPKGFGKAKNALDAECRKLAQEVTNGK